MTYRIHCPVFEKGNLRVHCFTIESNGAQQAAAEMKRMAKRQGLQILRDQFLDTVLSMKAAA